MGVLLAFAVGYVLGARGGNGGLDEIITSLKEIRDSEEFAAMVHALRSHAGHVLREAAEMVGVETQSMTMNDLLERVRSIATQGPTSTAS